MKKEILIIFLMCIAMLPSCTKEEPIEVVETHREIDTEKLAAQKSNLENRLISIGLMYGWGQTDKSNLYHTPDDLDMIVLKDGYTNANQYQLADLKSVKEKKATRVLAGVDLSVLADSTVPLPINPDSLIRLVKKYGLDGISVQLPESDTVKTAYVTNYLKTIAAFAGKGTNYYLILENPLTRYAENFKNANWVIRIHKSVDTPTLAGFTESAQQWAAFKFVPGVDFSRKDLSGGFVDTEHFVAGGRPSMAIDICDWSAQNQGGIAFYHIEKNYTDIVNAVTFSTFRKALAKLYSK